MILKNKKELLILRIAGKKLAKILKYLKEITKPGITTEEIDKIAYKLILKEKARPAFLKYYSQDLPYPYPATLCISINDEIVHGLPGKRIIKNGDLVSIDCGLKFHNLYVDSAITFNVGDFKEKNAKLIKATQEALKAGIFQAKEGNYLGDIGFAISKIAERYGFKVIKILGGHGIGYKLHEEPFVFNFGEKKTGLKLIENLVIAIEPMLTYGNGEVVLDNNGFTYKTKDKSLCAHFEHTIIVKKGRAEILTKDNF